MAPSVSAEVMDTQAGVSQLDIARHMVAQGALDAADLERAEALARSHRQDLRSVLNTLGLLSPRAWAQAAARVTGLPVLSAEDLARVTSADAPVTHDFQRAHEVVLLPQAEGLWRLAMADPTDTFVIEAVSLALDAPLAPVIALAGDIEETQNRLFTSDQPEEDAALPEGGNGLVQADDIERLRGLASEAPVIRFVNTMIKRAMECGASDIHVEPFERRYCVRYRVDGVLAQAEAPTVSMGPAVISRIKILAQLDIAERRLAQDGRIRFRSEGREIDLRISTMPSLHGESVVIRLLEQDGPPANLEALGMAPDMKTAMIRTLQRKHGLILVTGPTGSGKTTTLYAALDHLNTAERKIITIEDPVEFQIDQVIQTQVKPAIGLDFTRVLKSIVRQDPDVIMLGEMRDGETAATAVRSALTGHLVLSTLHTNDAIGAVTRLLDMGVEDYLLTSTVHMCVAQRLVRTLCTDCRQPGEPDAALLEVLERHHIDRSQASIMRPVGCASCFQRGYRGRTAIYEYFEPDAAFRRLVLERADISGLRTHARAQGMTSLYQAGLMKVAEGVTTLDEVERVTHESED